eukprot:767110-Hanusia_phi.AAC.4
MSSMPSAINCHLPKVRAPLLLVCPSRQLVRPMHQEVKRQHRKLELLVEEAEHVLEQRFTQGRPEAQAHLRLVVAVMDESLVEEGNLAATARSAAWQRSEEVRENRGGRAEQVGLTGPAVVGEVQLGSVVPSVVVEAAAAISSLPNRPLLLHT